MAQRNMIHQALTCIYTNLQENKFLVLPVWKIQISMSYFWNFANHTVKPFFFADSFSLAGDPLGAWRRMERGGESPITQDSPEQRGGSPDLSGLPPPGKKGRLELNGSPTGPRIRHNGAPLRPLGGKAHIDHEAWIKESKFLSEDRFFKKQTLLLESWQSGNKESNSYWCINY